jgi:FkbM family methyltransferase
MLKTKYKILIYNFIKKIFSLLGVDIKFKKNLSFDEIYQKYVRKKPIIIDVGANEGQSIERFSSIFNNCIIHSFEPINKCFDQMVKDFPGKNYYKNNYALSNKNTNRKFFINEQLVTSGFNKINKSYDHIEIKNKIKNTIMVKTIKLDTYLYLNKIKKVDILKIDTQGHELDVLKGAKNSLKNNIFHFVEVEIILCDYYIKKVNLYEIDRIMYKNNFSAFDLQEFGYDQKNQIKWFDMLYVNKNFL